MTIKQFSQLHKHIDDYFRKTHPDPSERERILARLSKISEELGELNNAVLSEFSWQRQEKLDVYEHHELETEWADVVNTLFSFALASNIDVEQALKKRIVKIYDRLGLDLDELSEEDLPSTDTGGK